MKPIGRHRLLGAGIAGLIIGLLAGSSITYGLGFSQRNQGPSTVVSTYTKTVPASQYTGEGISQVTILAGASTNQSMAGYYPDVITVVVGVNNTVIWDNSDTFQQTVTTTPSAPVSIRSGNINPTGTFVYTFTVLGTYDYTCDYFHWEHGTVIVKQGPAAAG